MNVQNKTVDQIVLAIQALDLEPIKFKLMDADEGQGWSREYVERMEVAYKRFLTLLVTHPETPIAPSKDIDKFWHGHILDTMKYAQDCENVFGYFLHHFPYFGMRGEQDAAALNQAGSAMQRLYREQFGEDMPRGEDASAAYCFAAKKADAAYCFASKGADAAYCFASKPSYCFAAKAETPAYCFAAKKADAAYCFASKGTNAAYCFASKPAYCFAAKAETPAYCFAAKKADAAYCFAAKGDKSAYCFASAKTSEVDVTTRPTLTLAA